MNWSKIANIAFAAIGEAAQLAPELKGEALAAKANTLVQTAAGVASQVLTDPTEQAEAAAAYAAAQSVLNLFASFHKPTAPATTAGAAS